MSDAIRSLLSIVSGLLMLYSLLIFIRILLSWFSGANFGKFYIYLCRITDPYLFWFSRFKIFRAGNIDLSPIAALALLTILNNIVSRISDTGRITLGFIAALILSAVWAAISFIIIFFIIVIALRLIAYLLSANIYSPFWQVVDYISRPVIFNINRLLFRNRIVNYLFGLLSAAIVLLFLYAALYILMNRIAIPLLVVLPI
jgi:YggT family protein